MVEEITHKGWHGLDKWRMEYTDDNLSILFYVQYDHKETLKAKRLEVLNVSPREGPIDSENLVYVLTALRGSMQRILINVQTKFEYEQRPKTSKGRR